MSIADPPKAVSHVEAVKLENPGFGGILLDEVPDLNRASLSDDAEVLLKSHGSYQQDDRDQRQVRKKSGQDRAWQFMVRTRAPGLGEE